MKSEKYEVRGTKYEMQRGTSSFAVIRYSSLIPGNSSFVPNSSNLKPRTSNLVPQNSSFVIRHSYFVPQTSYLVLRTSNLVPRTSYLILFALVITLFITGCRNDDQANHDTYTCPMHPTVVSDRPGACPVCGMDLVRKARPGEAVEITENLAKLIKSPNETVIASIKTISGVYKSVPISFEAQGIVTYDTRNIFTIPARIGGRLEKVFIKYPYQQVKKGQKIAAIYSPELLTAQKELLFLIENDAENKPLIESAQERLRLLGATEQQINALVQSKQVNSTFTIYSPYNGYVIAETQSAPVGAMNAPSTLPPPDGGMGDGMSPNSTSSNTRSDATILALNNASLLPEGSYVTSGQPLFRIVNPSILRVELTVPSAQAGAIKKGDRVQLNFGGDYQQSATIDLIQPFFDEGREFMTLRIYTNKTEQLQIGQLVQAKIQGTPVEALWVPKEAVLNLGVDNIIFVKENKVFKPRKVITGTSTENEIAINQGLSSSDEIAANAQYLVDGESFIKTQK